MSKTNKKHLKHRIAQHLSIIASLGLLLSMDPAPVQGQSLGAYGADICAEIGIPADECTLSTPDRGAEASSAEVRSDKTATLVEHGRRVCEQEGVPMEDCRALPSAYRKTDETILPASSFLTVPATIPFVDPGLVPAPVITEAPVPVRRQGVRHAHPPAQPVRPSLPYAGPSPVGADFRYSEPPPLAEPGVRYGAPALPPADVGFREALPPIEPPLRTFRQRQPAEPAFLYAEPPAPVAERPERIGRLERFREAAPSGRCLRAVRYSRPPSYRYVTC